MKLHLYINYVLIYHHINACMHMYIRTHIQIYIYIYIHRHIHAYEIVRWTQHIIIKIAKAKADTKPWFEVTLLRFIRSKSRRYE